MSGDFQAIIKSLKTKFVSKSIRTFDRATMIVVGVCWGAAIFMVAFAIYAASISASNKRAAETAAAAEPIMPKITRKPIEEKDAKELVDRLQRRYPGINISVGVDKNITVTTLDGAKFHDWLTVVRYVDIASPKYRWTLKEFCVGKCTGSLMRAVLSGETVNFEPPKDKKK